MKMVLLLNYKNNNKSLPIFAKDIILRYIFDSRFVEFETVKARRVGTTHDVKLTLGEI